MNWGFDKCDWIVSLYQPEKHDAGLKVISLNNIEAKIKRVQTIDLMNK